MAFDLPVPDHAKRDGVQPSPDRANAFEHSSPSPVFVDPSGRRLRRIRRVAHLTGLLCLAYTILVGLSVAGDVLVPVGPRAIHDWLRPAELEPFPSTTTTAATTASPTPATATPTPNATPIPSATPAPSASATTTPTPGTTGPAPTETSSAVPAPVTVPLPG